MPIKGLSFSPNNAVLRW